MFVHHYNHVAYSNILADKKYLNRGVYMKHEDKATNVSDFKFRIIFGQTEASTCFILKYSFHIKKCNYVRKQFALFMCSSSALHHGPKSSNTIKKRSIAFIYGNVSYFRRYWDKYGTLGNYKYLRSNPAL